MYTDTISLASNTTNDLVLPSSGESNAEGSSPRQARAVGVKRVRRRTRPPHTKRENLLLDMALDSTAEMDIGTISLDSNTDDTSLPGSSESDAEGSSPGKPVLNNFVPLPSFWWTQGTSGDTSQIPELLQHPARSRICIKLVQRFLPDRQKRWSEVVLPGHEPTIKLYSSLRPFPATHYSCGGLTARNKHELPQCLFYDPLFGQVAESLGLTNCSLDQPALKAAVSPKFGEWLMGLPQGWTPPDLSVNFAVLGTSSGSSPCCRTSTACSAYSLDVGLWIMPCLLGVIPWHTVRSTLLRSRCCMHA